MGVYGRWKALLCRMVAGRGGSPSIVGVQGWAAAARLLQDRFDRLALVRGVQEHLADVAGVDLARLGETGPLSQPGGSSG